MTVINDTRVVRLLRTAARIGHQHSGDEPYKEEVTNELVTASDVISLPPGSLITLQRGPAVSHTEEGSVLNFPRTEIGGVESGQTSSVTFSSEDAGASAAAIFVTEKDFSQTLTTAGDYAINYKTFQIKTYSPVSTTPGFRILITYAWAPIREFLEFNPEDLTPDLIAFGIGPHSGGGGSSANIEAGCGIESYSDGYTTHISLDLQGIAGSGLVVEPTIGGCPVLSVDLDAYQVIFDDSNSPLVKGSTVQEALETIDAYFQDIRGIVLRRHFLGSESFNYPLNTIYDFGSTEYEVGTGRLMIWVNGLFQNRFTDYAELSPTEVLFADPLDDDDEIDIVIFSGNFAGGQDIATFTLQLAYDNSPDKTIQQDNGQIVFTQTQSTGSALKLNSLSSITTALFVDQIGSGPGETVKSRDFTNPTLLVQKDAVNRDAISNTIIVERTTSTVTGGTTGIGSAFLTRLENSGTLLFDASKITTVATSATDSAERVDLVFSLSDVGTLSEKVRFKNDGKVGIGVSNPIFLLETNGDIGPAIDNTYKLGTIDRRWQDAYFGPEGVNIFSGDSETSQTRLWALKIDTAFGDGDLNINEGDQPRIIIEKDTGNVAIGDINAPEILSVGGTLGLLETTAPTHTSGYGKIYVKSSDSKLYYKNDSGIEFNIVEPNIGTTGNITLAVNSTTGNDTPTATRPGLITIGNFSSEPFLTIQAAINTLPDIIKHSINIYVDSGNYSGFDIKGKLIRGGAVPGSLQFNVIGTTGLFVPTTGANTGTATSGTNRTLTFAGAGWTANDFRGKYLSIISGTGNGQIFIIKSNTTDTITTVARMSPALDNTSVFEIIESKTIINSNSAGNAGVSIDNVYGRVGIQDISVDSTTYGFFCTASEKVYITRCLVDSANNGIFAQDVKCCSFSQVGVISSTVEAIALINIGQVANNEKGILMSANTKGMRVEGSKSYLYSGLSILNTTNLALELLFNNYNYIEDLEIDAASQGISIKNTYLSVSRCDISNCSNKTVDLTASSFIASDSLSGINNSGFGISCNAVDCTVEIKGIDATITGAEGDASIDGLNVLSWASDFPTGGISSYNAQSGARIART